MCRKGGMTKGEKVVFIISYHGNSGWRAYNRGRAEMNINGYGNGSVERVIFLIFFFLKTPRQYYYYGFGFIILLRRLVTSW